MANLVSIELNDGSLLVACAKSAGRRFQIYHLFEIDLTAGDSNAQIGAKLKAALAKKGVPRSELIAVVNRQQVEIREVTVPPAPETELPDLVRFQARNVFASMNENWSLDYVPFDDDVEGETRVLAIAASPQINAQYATIASSAGMKLKRIVFRPYAFCDLFEGRLSDAKNRLLIDPNRNQYDFTVVSGSRLIATRCVMTSTAGTVAELAPQIVNEVRRTIASTRSALATDPIEQIFIGGDETKFAGIKQLLSEKLDVPVVFGDPFRSLNPTSLVAAKPDHPELYSALIGSLVREYTDKKHRVDFVNPRKPIVKKRDYRKVLAAAGAVALLLIGGFAFGWYQLRVQRDRIAQLETQLANEKRDNLGDSNRPGVEQIIGEVEELDRWQMNEIHWLDQLAVISELLLTPDDIMVSSFRGGPLPRGDGFQFELTTRMTEATSLATDWKLKLDEHFDDVSFGDSKADFEDKDFPVTHQITLISKSDLGATVDKYTALADQLRLAATETQLLQPSPGESGGNENPDDMEN